MKLFFSSLFGAYLMGSATAATVSLNNTNGATTVALHNSAAMPLPAGTDYRVGFFLGYSTALDPILQFSSFEFLNNPANPNRFVPIGVGGSSVGDNKLNPPAPGVNEFQIRDFSGTLRSLTTIGNISYLDGAPNTEAAGLTRGTKLFLFLVNQTEFLSGTNMEWGIYSATDWLIPSGTNNANLALEIKNVDTSAEVFHGSLGSLKTAPIPEATSSALALGVIALGLLRRRL